MLLSEAFMVSKKTECSSWFSETSSFLKTLIEQGYALVYIDDILLFPNSKEHMFKLIEQLHLISTKHNLKSIGSSKVILLHYLVLYTQYNFLFIASPHPIHIFADQRHLLHCFTKKSNLSQPFNCAQMQLTKISRLKIIHTQEKKFLLLFCSVDLLQKLCFQLINLNTNNFPHKFT